MASNLLTPEELAALAEGVIAGSSQSTLVLICRLGSSNMTWRLKTLHLGSTSRLFT